MNYILHGTDKNRISQKLQAIKNKHQISNVIFIDAQNPEEDFLNEIDSFSIFDEEKMIIVDNASFFSAKNSTRYKAEDVLLRKESEYVVVYCVYSDKLDQRKKAIKEFVSFSTVYSCLALDDKSQKLMVDDLIKKYKLSMDLETRKYLYGNMGMDPLHIESEIEKLSIYSSEIYMEDAKALVTKEPSQDIFRMTDAYFDRNALLLLAYYRNFREQGMEPVAIVALLAGQIRFLYQIAVLMDEGYSQPEIAGLLKAHPYRVQLSMKKASRFSTAELLDHLEELADFDQNMKMGRIDKDAGFEQFVLNMIIE
ncbi:MAG: DNA polymerase III subunit delta [Bacillota bacterium]|nr:DNA polymerase III subunit delta [Bacillota bacterium]